MSGTVTPNFRLQKPPFDTIPWDQAINGNMDIIDATMAKYLTIPNFIGFWANATAYTVIQVVMDQADGSLWQCLIAHTSPVAPMTFAQARAAAPTQWGAGASVITIPTPAPDNAFRNKLHNSLALVVQQLTNPAIANNDFIIDRWRLALSLDVVSANFYTLVDADRAAIGDESAAQGIRAVVTGNAGAGSFTSIVQNIEDVRRLANRTVTVSFWAWNLTGGTRKVGVALLQNFGSGGSASVQVNGAAVTITTTPTRYSVTLVLPSVSGKTVMADSATRLQLFLSNGSTTDPISGGVGVQSGTFTFWGLQLELASTASTLEKVDPAYDAANCARFFWIGTVRTSGYVGAGVAVKHSFLLPARMRAAPVIVVPGGPSLTNLTGFVTNSDNNHVDMSGTGTATGAYVMNAIFTADASF